MDPTLQPNPQIQPIQPVAHSAKKDTNPLLLPLIIVGVLLTISLGFGIWAYLGRQDYKNNTDQKIAEAVAVAEENLTIKKDAEFVENYKLPYTTFRGPAAFGTLTFNYPKTWSNYLNQAGNTPVDGYMQPNFVSANKNETNYALRYQVVERQYDQEVKAFDSKVKNGRVATRAYRAPKQDTVLGLRVEGEIENRKNGVLVLLPLRDKTIKIWTEGEEFRADYEKILEELSFAP